MTRDRCRGDAGFTLVELVVVTLVGTIVLLAAYAVLDDSQRAVAETQRRSEATQRARTAMEVLTRTLRATMCSAGGTPAVAAAREDRLDVWVDETGGAVEAAAAGSGGRSAESETRSRPPDRLRLALEGTELVSYRWVARWSNPLSDAPSHTPALSDTPPRRVIATDVGRTAPGLPIFSYYGYPPTNAAGGPTLPIPVGGSGVAAADLGRIVRFGVAFSAAPLGGAGRVSPTALVDDVVSGTADPADDSPTLECGS